MPGIVVGVDGSDHSRRALIWAMRQAAGHHAPLTVLTVRPDPVRPATGIYWGTHAYPEDSHNPDVARKAIGEFAEQARNEIGETAPQVTVNVVTGDPAEMPHFVEQVVEQVTSKIIKPKVSEGHKENHQPEQPGTAMENREANPERTSK